MENESTDKSYFFMTKELFDQLKLTLKDKDEVKIMGSILNPSEITANLYKNLRESDSKNIRIIYMEDIPEEISGKAYQNRIEKASGGKVL